MEREQALVAELERLKAKNRRLREGVIDVDDYEAGIADMESKIHGLQEVGGLGEMKLGEKLKANWKKLFFDPQERISRTAFWLSYAVLLTLSVLVISACGIVLEELESRSGHTLLWGLGLMIFILLLLGHLWCFLALTAKRLHDSSMSALWVLTGAFLGIVLIVLPCLPSTKGPNKYGEKPFI